MNACLVSYKIIQAAIAEAHKNISMSAIPKLATFQIMKVVFHLLSLTYTEKWKSILKAQVSQICIVSTVFINSWTQKLYPKT